MMRLSTVLILILLASAACYAARAVPPSALELRIEELEKRVAELEKAPKIGGWNIDPGICPTPPGGFLYTPAPYAVPNGGPSYISTSGVLLINMPDRKVGL